ncbi:Protein LURP-one-related 17 [Morus notabilis]|uniref:Protein LURP-one-related 17 n=2 Tax=Morus notabilis TaxID=981085 RepID=W9SZD8_9ROSA|nr:Protein LURP-one-related 17 [Morus notabilis]
MKRFLSLKSLSRTVHINDHEEHGQDQDDDHDHQCQRKYDDDDQKDVVGRVANCTTSLTVWRKSLVMSCNGFTVIDSHGNLIYRVDNYIGRPEEIILMDGSGSSVLTMRRHKKLGLVDSWLVYEGEIGDHLQYCKLNTSGSSRSSRSKRPIFCIRKNINLLINAKSNVLAYVYRDTSDKSCAYVIEGSYTHRSCKVLDGCTKKVLAETRRKEEIVGGVSYGVEVFHLIVHPGFDPGFAMALVLLLDQMFS